MSDTKDQIRQAVALGFVHLESPLPTTSSSSLAWADNYMALAQEHMDRARELDKAPPDERGRASTDEAIPHYQMAVEAMFLAVLRYYEAVGLWGRGLRKRQQQVMQHVGAEVLNSLGTEDAIFLRGLRDSVSKLHGSTFYNASVYPQTLWRILSSVRSGVAAARRIVADE